MLVFWVYFVVLLSLRYYFDLTICPYHLSSIINPILQKAGHNFNSYWSAFESGRWKLLKRHKMFEMKEGNLYLGVTVAATSTDSIKISSIERTHGNNPIVMSIEGYRAGD